MEMSDQAKALAPYVQQLLYDEQVRDAARRALEASRDSYERARGRSAREAVSDKKLRRRLQQAIGATGEFWAALAEPRRPRKSRRWPKVAIVAAGGAALVLAINSDARATVMDWVASATNTSSGD